MATKFLENPVAQVRLAAEKTGEEFAASLSLSLGAIRAMERGTLSPGEQTRERMFIVYGVDTESIAASKGSALYARGGPYTNESYREWIRLTKVDEEKSKAVIETEVLRLTWLLKAAAINGSLFQTVFLLESEFEKIAKQGRLEGIISSFIRQAGSDASWFRLDSGSIGVVDHVLTQLGLDSKTPLPTPQ